MQMMQVINITLNLTALILSGMVLIAAISGGNLKEKVTRWFFVLVLITFIGTPGDTLIMLLWGTPGKTIYWLIRVIDILNFGIMGFTVVAAAMYFYEFLSTKVHVSRAFIHFQIVLGVFITVFVVIAQFVPILTWLDESNNYHKGSLFWMFELAPMLTLLSCVVLTLRNVRYLRPRDWVPLLLYAAIPFVCYIIEILIDGIWITYLGSAVMLFVVYMNIQVELRYKLLEKEAELAQGRIAMLISQIQPHFIFNTLSSISEVCKDNPLAQKCLITFSEYLRVNMDALSYSMPIAFEQELAHVKQYLWLEQLRFEEKLSVVYDIKEEDFMLPVLSLQPIVENAVHHGITRKASPGTVWISTERVGQGVRIVVRDDGVGFEPSASIADGRSHTGISNVRARLASMSRGWLSIHSVPGQGTTVAIVIPDEGGAA